MSSYAQLARHRLFLLLLISLVSNCAELHAGSDRLETYSILIDGTVRTYHVHTGPETEKPLPLLLVLHGGGGNGKALQRTYGFQPMIERGEAIAVYPDALNGSWMPEDVFFLDILIDEVLEREKVDPARLFVTGASRGGLMTFIMCSQSRHRFAAAGTVIASNMQFIADTYPIKRPIDFAMIAGTEDPLMPYDGGWGAMRQPRTSGDPEARVLPVEEVIESLVALNGITETPKVTSLGNAHPEDGCTNEVHAWTLPDGSRRVMLVKVLGGGHVAPGGRQYLPQSMIGPACYDFDHAEVMWAFFQKAKPKVAWPILNQISPPNSSEAALRERVDALFQASRTGDIESAMALTDPSVIEQKGELAMRQFFRFASRLVQRAEVGSEAHRIQSITYLEDGDSARVITQLYQQDNWGNPSRQIWVRRNGTWFYQETLLENRHLDR